MPDDTSRDSRTLVEVPLARLKRPRYHAAKITRKQVAKLARLIEEFGQERFGIPVWNIRTGNVIAGLEFVRALRKLGRESALARVLDIPVSLEKQLWMGYHHDELKPKLDERAIPLLAEIKRLNPSVYGDVYEDLDFEATLRLQATYGSTLPPDQRPGQTSLWEEE